MNRLQFLSAVRLSRGPGHPVEEIDNVADAMVFLREWPVGRRGPVYRCALNCCAAAMAAQMSAEEARKSFAGFARITGLLVDDGPTPLIAERHAAIRRLAS
ncbi:DUF982 domain-containing protein [Mesorhizobium sp. SP-1A]|uniref:DUF982 domain-containing protein n=1 Tax=Mesorhizobium sp. SP-1A TaxID=3077840 RepID=UPI0028F7279C|nr:DUF982 domain-containing protein [Mesorhizobium sp. SP-1A]